jgi:hypothetical protein
MNALYLTPEIKYAKAQASQRATVDRLRGLLESQAREELSVGALEEMALQLRLGSINLMTCARELREVEEERKVLLRAMEKHALRFEPEPLELGHTFIEGRASA